MSNAKIPMTCICPNSKCHAQCVLSLDNVLGSLAENNVPKIMSIRKYTMVCLLRAWIIGGRIIVAWKLMHGPHFIAPIFSAKYTLCILPMVVTEFSPFHFIVSINRMLCLHKSFEDKSLVSRKT